MLMVWSVTCSPSCHTITHSKQQDQQLFNPKQTTLHLKSVVSGVYYMCTLQCFSDFSVSTTFKYYLLYKLQENWAEAAKNYHILHLNVPSISNILIACYIWYNWWIKNIVLSTNVHSLHWVLIFVYIHYIEFDECMVYNTIIVSYRTDSPP